MQIQKIIVVLFVTMYSSLSAITVSVGYDLNANQVMESVDQQLISTYAGALYARVYHLIYCQSDQTLPDGSSNDQGTKRAMNNQSSKQTNFTEKEIAQLVAKLIKDNDVQEIFRQAHRVGISDKHLISAASKVASQWSDSPSIKVFQGIKKVKKNEEWDDIRTYCYLAGGVTVLLLISGIYFWH